MKYLNIINLIQKAQKVLILKIKLKNSGANYTHTLYFCK